MTTVGKQNFFIFRHSANNIIITLNFKPLATTGEKLDSNLFAFCCINIRAFINISRVSFLTETSSHFMFVPHSVFSNDDIILAKTKTIQTFFCI